jgi:hypothetical protein
MAQNSMGTEAERRTPRARRTPMLDQEEAARFLHVQPRTLESWRQRRIGPRFVRYSMRCVRYRQQDLQVWLDSQAIESESPDRG